MPVQPESHAPEDPPFEVGAVLEAVLSKLRVLAETGQTFGQPITIGETIIIPYMSLHFGLGGAGGTLEASNRDERISDARDRGSKPQSRANPGSLWGGAGGGVRIEPIGFLVVRGDRVELLSIDQQPGTWSKVADQALPLLQQWLQTHRTAPAQTEDPE